MLSSTVLTAEDIIEIINLKGEEKGIEVTHVEITKGIEFMGKIRSKINSTFRGVVYIKSFSENKIILETQKLNITSLGLLKGASNIILKAVVKMLGEDYINIKDNNIIIDLAKINSEAILYNTSISDVYIKDKALYIIGTNLDMYLNA